MAPSKFCLLFPNRIFLMTTFFPSHSRGNTKKFTSTEDENAFNSAQLVYDEVLRKNHEMMKGLLTKMTEIYNRQEQYEQAVTNLNGQLEDLEKNNQNLHHEMRTNHLQVEKKQQVLANDLRAVKNILKIPDPARSHQQYLTSGFFKEQSALLNNRTRRGKTVPKTNKVLQKSVHVIKLQDDQRKHVTVEESHRCQYSQANLDHYMDKKHEQQIPRISMKEVSIAEEYPKNIRQSIYQVESVINQKLKDFNEQFQSDIVAIKNKLTAKQSETDRRIQEMRQQLQQKLGGILKDIKTENQWNNIDFEQLQKYLDSKVKEQLTEYVNKNYFQESISNLKQAWQAQLDHLTSLLQQKISIPDLLPLQDKINELTLQQDSWLHLNSLKIHNISYNSTCKSTPYRVNLERISAADQESSHRLTRQSQENKAPKKNQLKYCNSLSTLNRRPETGYRNITPRKASGDISRVVEEVSQQKWKEKAADKLGLNLKRGCGWKKGN